MNIVSLSWRYLWSRPLAAVLNLLVNALDAMQAQPERQLWLSGQAADGVYRLQVRDNGSGIPLALRKHLFEPFFTTKPGEQGLGLGLILAAAFVHEAGQFGRAG